MFTKMCLIFMDKITVFFLYQYIYENGTRQRYTCYACLPSLEETLSLHLKLSSTLANLSTLTTGR